MESTGVYWKPVWNVLEEHFHMVLANAQHIKAVPGRKTDMMDCQWIAELLRHGLLRGSYVPSPVIRDLRDLTRTRAIPSPALADKSSTVDFRSRKRADRCQGRGHIDTAIAVLGDGVNEAFTPHFIMYIATANTCITDCGMH
jgi:transposase